MPYCTNCGKIHDLTTAGCYNNYTTVANEYVPWVAQPVATLPSTIESRLDHIIDLLTQILVKVGK